ncbi:MAG: YciI family protein [Microbacteriaceae bacterium]
MAVFAVTYTYDASPDQLSAIRPTHREFLAELLNKGVLLASGPMVDLAAALLVVKADSVDEVAAILDADPFEIAGFIGERTIAQWNPVFGPWSAE